ncbi:MAG TPA: DUF881 domain-containing protein [Isoptericola sp.]|nr:DUF881 domain-containing protein [Isoptericola sp.]
MSDPKGDRPETPDGPVGEGAEDVTAGTPSSDGPDSGTNSSTEDGPGDSTEVGIEVDTEASIEVGTDAAASAAPAGTTDDTSSDPAAAEAPASSEEPEPVGAPAGGDSTAGDGAPQDGAQGAAGPSEETAADVEPPPAAEPPPVEGPDAVDGDEVQPPQEEPTPAGPAPGPVDPTPADALVGEDLRTVPPDDRTDERNGDRTDDRADADGPEAAPAAASGWRRLGAALRPRASRSQVLAGVLCAALGFALVVQVQQSASDQLSSARQEDLVRLLDEVTDRAQQLGDEVSGLEATRDELESGSGQARSALELAEQRAESEGILSGRLPAQGPGVRVTIQDPNGALKASQMFNVLEELRNAGAEVVELNGVRLVTSTWFEDEGGAIVVDGTALSSPYEWTVVGDPETMDRALEIPGGALATVRTAGAEASTALEDEVKITAVAPPQEPEYAQPERERD